MVSQNVLIYYFLLSLQELSRMHFYKLFNLFYSIHINTVSCNLIGLKVSVNMEDYPMDHSGNTFLNTL